MNSWKHIKDGYPISGPYDTKFDGSWFEIECEVMDDAGKIEKCEFWACWQVEYDSSAPDEFLMEFSCSNDFNVMYWRTVE